MSSATVYLDHNATTPIAPEVAEAMWPYLTEHLDGLGIAFGQTVESWVEGFRRLDRDALVAEVGRFSGAELVYAGFDTATKERLEAALA